MVPKSLKFDRERLLQICFFLAFAWVTYQLFLLARPFMPGLLGAVMLAMAFSPLRSWVQRRLKSSNLTALAMSLGVLLIVVLPLFGIGQIIVKEAGRLLPTVQAFLEDAQNQDLAFLREKTPLMVQTLFFKISNFFSFLNVDLKGIFLEHVSDVGTVISASGILVARHALFTLFNGLVMAVVLFFLFRDGDRYLKWVISVIPMRSEHKQTLALRVYETFRAVTIGVLTTAAAQGFMATLGFWIADIRLPLLLGIATGMVSLLGASFIVTFPVALWTFAAGSPKWGIFLFLWGAIPVGLLDNILKPVLIGSRARMPFVLTFFSILGGLKLYGLMGVILGPILVASFLTFVKIYREEYHAS